MTSTSPRTDPGAPLLSYSAMLDLSPHSLRFVRDLIIRDRRRCGGSWYRMPPGRQGLLVLVWFRKNHTFAELAGGFNVGLTTAWRYVQQVLSLLAPLAASLPNALAAADRNRFIVLDGTCIGIDRVADRRYWCGQHRRDEVNIQALISPEGDPVWTSPGLAATAGTGATAAMIAITGTVATAT